MNWAERARWLADQNEEMAASLEAELCGLAGAEKLRQVADRLRVLADTWEAEHPEKDCSKCEGSGEHLCEWCKGMGRVKTGRRTHERCSRCRQVASKPGYTTQLQKCTNCGGTGKVRE